MIFTINFAGVFYLSQNHQKIKIHICFFINKIKFSKSTMIDVNIDVARAFYGNKKTIYEDLKLMGMYLPSFESKAWNE